MATEISRLFSVRGTVLDADGKAAIGVRVQAYDRDLRSEELLGQTTTDLNGSYIIHYGPGQFARAEKKFADLSVKVLDRNGKTPLYSPGFDDILFNAPPAARVNINLPPAPDATGVEYEIVLRCIKPLLNGTDIHALDENDRHRDISFLARETGLLQSKIEHLVLSHRLQDVSDITPVFFYALLRQDTLLSGDLDGFMNLRFQIHIHSEIMPLFYDIVLTDEKKIRRDVEAAIKAKIVPAGLKRGLNSILARLAKHRKKAQEYQQSEKPRLTLDLIADFIISDKVGDMQRLFVESNYDISTFLAALADPKFFATDKDKKQATTRLALADVLGFNDQIIDDVRKIKKIRSARDVRKLAGMNRAEWRTTLSKSAAKIAIAGKPVNNKLIGLHASSLVRRMEKRFPSAAFAAQLQRAKKSSLKHRKEIANLLTKNADFDLMNSNVDSFLKRKKLNNAKNDGLRRELKSVQRVFRLIPHYGKSNALLKQKIHSAQTIVAIGETRFRNEIAAKAGIGKKEATIIYNRAAAKHSAAMLIAGDIQDTMRSVDIAALKPEALAAKIESVAADFPNLKSLFKLTDVCECEHCRSVYSPAAYLVELLQFLDKRSVTDLTTDPPTTGHLAKDVLFKRRPDLGDIDLSCENATTPLPYIDLVCELLEEAVAPDPGIPYTGAIVKGAIPAALLNIVTAAGIPMTAAAVIYEPDVNGDFILRDEKAVCKLVHQGGNDWLVRRLRQTHGTEAELAAAPEYVNVEAYKKLANSNYAFKLPFDLPHVEALAYFARFGIARDELMRDFQRGGTPADSAIAAEKLGLTDQERAIIVTAAPATQSNFWNIPAAALLNEIRNVDTFLTRTGLSYRELDLLLQLSFIDPNGKMFIKHLDLSCDTAQKQIAGLNTKGLDRIHRFLRIMRRLKQHSWQPETCNEVIVQARLGNSKLNDNCLIIAADLMRLKERSGLRLEELVACYGEIPHSEYRDYEYQPLYQSVFLNKAANGIIDEGLQPENVDGSTPLSDYTSSLALSLQVSEQDIDDIRTAYALADLTFANLSVLFAVTRLSAKLKLSVSDFLIYRDMTGLDIFSSPAVTLTFDERVIQARTSPLSITEVRYMLRHEAEDLTARSIADEKIAELLAEIQLVLQDVYDSHRTPYNDELSADEMKPDVKRLLQTLPGITEEIANAFLKLIDRQWVSPPDPDAADFIDEVLAEFFDTADIKARQSDLAAAAGPDFESERKALIESLLAAIADYLYQLEKSLALTSILAAAFATEEDLVEAVLDHARLGQPMPGTAALWDLLSSDDLIDLINEPAVLPPIDSVVFADQFRALRLLHKLLPLATALQLDAEDLGWLLAVGPALGWLPLDGIPYENGQTALAYSDWEALLAMLDRMRKLRPVADPADAEAPLSFSNLMEMLLPGAGSSREDWLDAMSLLSGYDRDLLDELDTYFGFALPDLDAYRLADTWHRIELCMEHLHSLGVELAQVKEFVKAVLTADDTQSLRTALKVRYDETLWLTTLAEIMDKIRPQKRDALLAYLLVDQPGLKEPSDLFDYLLVDVQMEACMPSSRIVQAHGSIQLFVQRCLMGLEPTAAADVKNDKSWDQWQWMRQYRVWEANRKVFLYPENWIEPELLDDKSSLFSDLENELLENEVNEFTTEDALIRYLEKLDDIAFLEVVACYYQSNIYTMHVFARTKGGDPAQYYYRRFEKERYWTPWETVDLDITSDQLLAFVRNDRLHLAWPVFSDEHNPNQKSTVPGVTENPSDQDMTKPELRLKIQLAISQYANNSWKPKKVSQDAITTPQNYTTSPIDRKRYTFVYNQYASQIVVFHTDKDNDNEYHTQDGVFDVAGCKGYPELVSTAQQYLPDFLPDFKDAILRVQRYLEENRDATDELAIRNILPFFIMVQRLAKTPGTFRITYPHQFSVIDFIAFIFELLVGALLNKVSDNLRYIKLPFGTLMPYFFEDSAHAYAVIPGFYGREKTKEGEAVELKRSFSDVLMFIEDICALINKYVLKLKEDPNQDVQALLRELVADPDYHAIVSEWSVYRELKYGEQFKNLYHPLICHLRTTLYKDGVPALMERDTQLYVNPNFDFNQRYLPNAAIIPQPFPIEDLDFSSEGSYSSYNWELFYHAPLLLATRLSKNQKFEEALTWFHYMFNPTGTLEGTAPQKYWVTKPFYQASEADYIAQRIDTLLHTIADPGSPERNELEFAVEQWRSKPFSPHVIARNRPVAYQKTLLMKYIDNLIEWGDYNFRQDTMESIAQATQLYILADKLLGPKPRTVPAPVKVPYQTYNQIEADLDAFGNALVEFENLLPDLSVLPEGGAELPPPPFTLASLYFCIPQNDRMLEYWDRIEDRLFKIRHCQNIDGIERSLALFAPPIDPAALVRAAAAGLDISSVLAGLNAPLPHYRFQQLAQKATELTQELRSLGSALLQALEKKDAEALALLRSEHEIALLKATRDTKLQQIEESKEQIEVLNKSKAVTEERRTFYAEIEKIIPNEQLNLDKLSEAQDFQFAAQVVQATGGVLGLIPDFNIGGHGAGGSPAFHATFGGSFLAEAANAAAGVLNIFSGIASFEANRASILGGYDRRFDDWKLQERLAEKDLEQIDQQIVAAEIRKQMAETDLKNHDLQIENAEKTDEFMRSKYTNQELYQWMINKVSSVYFKAYQLAYDVAKKAERCYQHELGSSETFLEFGYWDSLKKGLQTAGHLYHDIKRMEVGYLDNNKREYELTKHVSLALLDPLALVRFKATGVCDFEIPEALFDMDHPGQYFRRLKSLSISLPCIAGPYTSVSARLSQLSNKYRKSTAKAQGAGTPKEEYEELTGNDERFSYNVGSIQSLATSNGQNDGGLFELNFRDERYLPFEGSGAVSSWRLELPQEVRQFDYNTINDVIIHVRYTAREGGSTLRGLAETSLKEKLGEIRQELSKTGLHVAVNLKHDMPNEWHQLLTAGTVNLQIGKERLPYFAQALDTEIDTITFIAKAKDNPASYTVQLNDADLILNRNDEWQLCLNDDSSVELDTAFALAVAEPQLADLEELMLVVKYVFS